MGTTASFLPHISLHHPRKVKHTSEEKGQYLHNEPHLLTRAPCRTIQHLRGKVRPKRHQPRRHKAIPPLIPLGTQRRPGEQGREVERRQRIQHDHLVRGVGVDALIQREERG